MNEPKTETDIAELMLVEHLVVLRASPAPEPNYMHGLVHMAYVLCRQTAGWRDAWIARIDATVTERRRELRQKQNDLLIGRKP